MSKGQLSPTTTGYRDPWKRLALATNHEPTSAEAFAKLVARFGETAELEYSERRTPKGVQVNWWANGKCNGKSYWWNASTPNDAVTGAIAAADKDAEAGPVIDTSTSQIDSAHDGGVLGRITRAGNGVRVEPFEE